MILPPPGFVTDGVFAEPPTVTVNPLASIKLSIVAVGFIL